MFGNDRRSNRASKTLGFVPTLNQNKVYSHYGVKTDRNNFSIDELAKATGTKVEIDRYYEQVGILPTPPRAAGDYRSIILTTFTTRVLSAEGRRMSRYKQSSAFQRRAAIKHWLRSPFAREGDFPLPKAVRGAMLDAKSQGIWRMSTQNGARYRRLFSIVVASLLVMSWSLRADAQSPRGNKQAGLQLALRSCASCHMVIRDQDVPPMPDYAPTFFDIAKRPGISTESVRAFLSEPPPMHRMTDPQLTSAEISDVTAYLLSLRSSR